MALVAIYQGDFVNDAGTSMRWQIVEDGGSFVASLTGSGRGFLSTSWKASGDDEYSPFLVSTSRLTIFDTASSQLYDDLVELLTDNQARKYQLYIRDMTGGGSGQVTWRGYVDRGSVSANEDGVRSITITANDGIGFLKDAAFSSSSGPIGVSEDLYSGRATYTSLLSTLLLKTGLGGDIYISCGHYPRLTGAALTANGGVQLADTQNPMDFVYVDRGIYRTNGNGPDSEKFFPIPTYDVLTDVLTTWGATLFQYNGDWHVIQVNKRGNNTLRRWRYDQNGAAVGGYADVTTHVITPTDEELERSPGTISVKENYDSVRVTYAHGEYRFMPNPGFAYDLGDTRFFKPVYWTASNSASGRYQDIGNGDGQFVNRIVQTRSTSDIPTTVLGTGAGSVDAFVSKYCDPSTTGAGGNGLRRVLTEVEVDAVSKTITWVDIDERYPIDQLTPLWVLQGGTYKKIIVAAGQYLFSDNGQATYTDVDSPTAGTELDVYAKLSSTVSSSSRTDIGANERIQVTAEFLPGAPASRIRVPSGVVRVAWIQVKLAGTSGTRYLALSGGSWAWTSSVAWIQREFTFGDWNIINIVADELTPFDGTITITVGPGLEYMPGGTDFTNSEITWDNVDVRPVVVGDGVVNRAGKTVYAYASTQTTEAARIREVSVRVGDAPISPAEFGMSLDSDGLIDTGDWEEAPVGAVGDGTDHESLLAKVVLRSMRSPRELQSATYFALPTLPTAWHVISRSGSEWAPSEITVNWVSATASGSWYKVTESGFTGASQAITQPAAFVSSRGGIGQGSSGLLQGLGKVLFADGSQAITRTSAVISAGVVTSISTEPIVEPIFKDEDLIVIVGSDLSFVQARISADQDALATSLSIEDPDNPGTGVTFDEDMPYPAAIYFIEQKLLTLARLGEQGFAVTVLGENIGKVNGAQSGTLTSLNVKEWAVSIASGTTLYLTDDVTVTLTAAAPRGSTTISFSSTNVGSLSDDQVIKPAGSVPRADFKVTADAITAYLGNPGSVIATVSGTVTYDAGNTRSSVPVSTSLTVDLKGGDPILFYASDGNIVKGIVNADVSAGATPILIDGDISGTVESGDKVVPGSLTGLRIDMSGISVLADRFASTNYSAGSAGWAILGDGSAEFNNITARGSIAITGTSSGITNFSDAGAAVTWDTADNVVDGSTKSVTTIDEKTGAGRAFTGLNSSANLVTSVIPATAIGTPGSPGLFLGSDYMGYHTGSGTAAGWKTFMDSSGNFYLGGTSGNLQWNAGTNELTVNGAVTISKASGFSGSGVLTVGTGIKDSTLSGWALDSGEIVGQLLGVDQVVMNTSGKIVAGAGNVTLDATGIVIDGSDGDSDFFMKVGGTTIMNLTVNAGAGLGSITGLGWVNIENPAGLIAMRASESGAVTGGLTLYSNAFWGGSNGWLFVDAEIVAEHTSEFRGGIQGYGLSGYYSENTSVTVSNTVSATSFISSGSGTNVIPADMIGAGTCIMVKAAGHYTSNGGSNVLSIRVKVDGTQVWSRGVVIAATTADDGWALDVMVTFRTTTTAIANGFVYFEGGDASGNQILADPNTSTTAVSNISSTSTTIDVEAQWNSADVNDSVTCTNIAIYTVRG